jgi:hypothetical protein
VPGRTTAIHLDLDIDLDLDLVTVGGAAGQAAV